jgi:PAS domain-containing protein
MNEPTTKTQEISELVRRLCVALSNVEAFSPDHALAKKHVAGAYQCLSGLLQRLNRPLVISASEKRFLFDHIPMEDRNPLVEKFASRLEEIGANHLSFDPELTEAEFLAFYRLLGRGSKHINENGGLTPLLEAAQVTHIKTRRIDFVMVNENEKVVSKSARVVEGDETAAPVADATIVEYVLQKVLAHTEDQQWLVQEMKNNPQRAADLLLVGIKLASSRAEMGLNDDDAGLEALIKNIQLLGGTLATAADAAAPEEREDLEKAITLMEREIRQRSSRLTSSKIAAGLLSEMLGVITSYTDRTRARTIANEFIQGERSLDKAERLLRNLTPAAESVDSFIARIRDQLLQQGVTPDDLARLETTIKRNRQPKPRVAAARKPRTRSSQAVAQGIAKRLQDLNLAGPQLDQAVESLSSFVEARAREKAGDLHLSVDRLQGQVTRRDSLLLQLPVGVVIWNGTGTVELANPAAEKILGFDGGVALSGTLAARLRDDNHSPTAALPANESQLLRSVSIVLKGDNGEIYGVVLSAPNGR